MLCVRPDGTIFSHDGDSCPTGTSAYSTSMPETGPKTADGKVIPGTADKRPIGVYSYLSPAQGTVGGGSSVYQAMAEFERLRIADPNAYKRIVNQLRRAGLISDRVTSSATIADTYRTVLEASAASVEEGQPMTPGAMLAALSEGEAGVRIEEDGVRAGAAAYTGPTSTVDLTNETTAYTLLNTAARDMIGRDLTPEEVRKYTNQLNKIEMQSARTATPQGQAMTVYSGGVDRDEVVRQLISDNPDFAGYQLNHQIMDTMLADIDEGQAFLNEWS